MKFVPSLNDKEYRSSTKEGYYGVTVQSIRRLTPTGMPCYMTVENIEKCFQGDGDLIFVSK